MDGKAAVLTGGTDATNVALAATVPRAVEAAGRLAADHGIRCSVVDVRSLVPLDTHTILAPHVPLPAADALEDHALPSVARIMQTGAQRWRTK
jgi:pyruvate/2-oxoglutarate/acetoin dehydrogenase E1 component